LAYQQFQAPAGLLAYQQFQAPAGLLAYRQFQVPHNFNLPVSKQIQAVSLPFL
jgi:hypothetical protein